ncbi:MAG: NAD(P)/FAD-dependent oxidoreductase [Pyrinomonadaceae bacterium]
MAKQKVIIIGAGLAGSLLSTFLARRGIEADVYEARGDMRTREMSAGRSINLALSDRGIAALKQVGMDEYMLREAVPMVGRMIHSVDGETKLLPYSGREGEYINSVSRGGLNVALINEADNYPASRFHFNRRCVDFDCRSGEALIENAETGERFSVAGETLIATDGAGSAVRRAMMTNRDCIERFNYSQTFLEHGYKELSIPPRSEFAGDLPPHANDDGEFLLEKNALHIWARHQFMMIALPNFDGSFTCTLFLAHAGQESFQAIESGVWRNETDPMSENQQTNPQSAIRNPKSKKALFDFFKTNFPDALPLMPNLEAEFFSNPTGNLGTIKCFPWNVRGKALLLGDAAHAMVPFYGQGMNCAFEDCRVFDSLIEEHDGDWEKIFNVYAERRKPNADAICDLAEENFYEMRDAVADPVFQRKRQLETLLEQTYPDYFSKYSMVTFREDLPYRVAKEKGNSQDELLMRICAGIEDVGAIDLGEVMEKVKMI